MSEILLFNDLRGIPETFAILDTEARLQIAKEVQTCPYCDGPITLYFEEWEEDEKHAGLWLTGRAKVDCDDEPDMDSDEWENWFQRHSDMPYVHQLPVELLMTEWVNARYRFRLE